VVSELFLEPTHLQILVQDHNSWHHFPKVDMNKFDGSDPSGWVTQMEHYFSLHGIIDDLHKLKVGVLYLDVECWQWWKWYKKAYKGYIAWTQFVQVLYAHFECDTHHLGCLTKLCQTSTIMEYITTFEQLAIHTEGQSDLFFKECFISGLKECN
jgi:hypothetical protein